MINVQPGLDVLHSLAGAHRVHLLPGTHRVSRPWRLNTTSASGLIVTGDNATISGGVPITNWSLVTDTLPRVQHFSKHIYHDADTRVDTRGGASVLWEAPLPDGFDADDLGVRMQMWRGETRLTLARSPTLRYVKAMDTNITFYQDDILPNYYDFASVHLVLYESCAFGQHRLDHNLPRQNCSLSSPQATSSERQGLRACTS
jgi:hypothetical protein